MKHENVEALRKGFANLERHIGNVKKFGVPVVVGVNRFSTDTKAEHDLVKQLCAAQGVEAVISDHWATGSAGSEDLGKAVIKTIETKPANFKTLYPDEMPLLDKIKTIATSIYGAAGIAPEAGVAARIKEFEAAGFGNFPICIAKTQYSFSTNPDAKGAPIGPHHSGARSAPVRRRGVHRRDLRRGHDHAGPAARAGGEQHHGLGRRENLGLVLGRCCCCRRPSFFVTPGLDPGVHPEKMDARVKPGHDGEERSGA